MASGSRYVIAVDDTGYLCWERAPAYLISGRLRLGWVEAWFQRELLAWIDTLGAAEVPASYRELAAQIQRRSMVVV